MRSGCRASFFELSAPFLARSSLASSWTKPARSGSRLVVTAHCSVSILTRFCLVSSCSLCYFPIPQKNEVPVCCMTITKWLCQWYVTLLQISLLFFVLLKLSTPHLKVGISVTAKILSIICFILGYFFSRRSSIIDSTETKEDDLGRVQSQAQANPAFDGDQQERWRQAYVPFRPEKTVKNN